jgi:hypothetical protein
MSAFLVTKKINAELGIYSIMWLFAIWLFAKGCDTNESYKPQYGARQWFNGVYMIKKDTITPKSDTVTVRLYQMTDTLRKINFIYADKIGAVHYCDSCSVIITGFAKMVNGKMMWADNNQTILSALDKNKKPIYRFLQQTR